METLMASSGCQPEEACPFFIGADKPGTTARVDPEADQDPFYVLLENDKLISVVAVETDVLLEPVPDPENPGKFVAKENAVRLLIAATVRPYRVALDMTAML
jgi:hypothetical protein